ncbi:helix-turn-helix domain-containing protein [Aestuariibacter halophilus]|uniref:Helix-turn-helix domain-containing protein n=1 Tax=Fluctibacter halophilus TaxID=226011 RepID=A0ABS8G815_9ALTE|nr:YdaS family helix-turn-helix protein [Aestuariibacter halophilus]MCC2615960.1 helix-turn-helix domain-containing protein [Aestuariibacter halophilus]
MNQLEALKQAIQIVANGNQSEFARKLEAASGKKVSQQLVSKWINEAEKCSHRFVVDISQLTGGAILCSQLRPDVFPPSQESKAA